MPDNPEPLVLPQGEFDLLRKVMAATATEHAPGPRRMTGRTAVCYCRGCGRPWPCDGSWQVRAERAEAKLAALDAVLPEDAEHPVTPGLLAALVALQVTARDQRRALEGGTPRHTLVPDEDLDALDEASDAVEDLLFPPTPDEEDLRLPFPGEQP